MNYNSAEKGHKQMKRTRSKGRIFIDKLTGRNKPRYRMPVIHVRRVAPTPFQRGEKRLEQESDERILLDFIEAVNRHGAREENQDVRD